LAEIQKRERAKVEALYSVVLKEVIKKSRELQEKRLLEKHRLRILSKNNLTATITAASVTESNGEFIVGDRLSVSSMNLHDVRYFSGN
jgi:hypothetical protein